MARNFNVQAVHKGMYPGINFRDDADGAEPAGWTSNNDASCSTVIIASLDGHRKVLQFYDFNAAGVAFVKQTFTTQTSGTIEIWIRSNDVTDRFQIQILDPTETDIGIQIQFESDKIQYYHTAAWNDATGGGILNNVWYHCKIVFDCTPDTYSFYLDGVLLDADIPFRNVLTNIGYIRLTTDSADSSYRYYIDAIGYSWDTDYKIGDNCFWKHYGESAADTFEEDDVGTQGNAITWVDTVDTAASFEIVNEFNEHKKVLRANYSSAAGGFDIAVHDLLTWGKTGWVEVWYKTDDITVDNYIDFRDSGGDVIIYFGVGNSVFEYQANGGAWTTVPGSPTPVADTWYHFYVQWYDAANDTWDLWINNVQYLDGVLTVLNQTNGIFYIRLLAFSATKYMYIDAPICSLDGDSRGDNRLFDYNATYTKQDITSTVSNVLYSNFLHGWRSATMLSKVDYEPAVLFLQIYDVTSALAMEAEIANRRQDRENRIYTLVDRNYDDLKKLSSNTFVTAKIHDPTVSGCMLKTILPNVSEADGDLILVNADTKTDAYSPVTKNYPDGQMLIDIADIADSCVIIEANGKVHLDDDLASGDALDFDTAADRLVMIHPPKINDILDTLNYFEIFGAIDPDTGERFYKIVDNSGTDKKRRWRCTNNNFRSQADVDAYATKLSTKLIPVREISIGTQGLKAHNMGTTFTYKHVDGTYNVPSAAYYVIEEAIDMDTAAATIKLSDGVIESSKYAAGFEWAQNYSDSDMAEIYETDIITTDIRFIPINSVESWKGYLLGGSTGGSVIFYWLIDEQVDDTKDIVFTWTYACIDGVTGATIDGTLDISTRKTDGTERTTWDVEEGLGVSLPSDDDGDEDIHKFSYILVAADFEASNQICVWLSITEANSQIYLQGVTAKYYIKRTLP